jgi:high-affinity Fe2+/Pb2+ permease
MELRKSIGIAFMAVALITLGILISQTQFSIQLQDWVRIEYYLQFSPYFISIMLFYCGLYLFQKKKK